jgi:hypothetical protein
MEEQFKQGFNDGYIIAAYDKDLSAKLSKIESPNLRLEGMQSGIEQYELEQLREVRTNAKEHDRDVENER